VGRLGTTVTNTGFLTANGANASLYLATTARPMPAPGAMSAARSRLGGARLPGGLHEHEPDPGHIYGAGAPWTSWARSPTRRRRSCANSGTYTLYGGTISGAGRREQRALTFSNGGGTLSGVSVINAVTVRRTHRSRSRVARHSGKRDVRTSDDVYLGQNLTVGSV